MNHDIKGSNVISRDPDICRDCLCCELACSYHHSEHKLFNPATSSIKVLRDNDDGEITIDIDETCDECVGEDAPLCVRYCVFGALRVVK